MDYLCCEEDATQTAPRMKARSAAIPLNVCHAKLPFKLFNAHVIVRPRPVRTYGRQFRCSRRKDTMNMNIDQAANYPKDIPTIQLFMVDFIEY